MAQRTAINKTMFQRQQSSSTCGNNASPGNNNSVSNVSPRSNTGGKGNTSSSSNPLKLFRTSQVIHMTIGSTLTLVVWFYVSIVRHHMLPSSLSSSTSSLLSWAVSKNQNNNNLCADPATPRRLGILVGIFTADMPHASEYRSRHRKLFTLWNDPRVCSLAEFQHQMANPGAVQCKKSCELIYTFVVGANPKGPTEWMEQEDEIDDYGMRPPSHSILVADAKGCNFTAADLLKKDVTRLNIRENMNQGKSQTWFKYAHQLMEEYPPNTLSYVMKLDADAILHLHEFFHFAYRHLPPTLPYSQHKYVGALRDKAYWPKKGHLTVEQQAAREGYFGSEFEGVHLYLAGQCYIVSQNLAHRVAVESRKLHDQMHAQDLIWESNNQTATTSYLEGHEDHDIAAMILHDPEPVHMITVGRKQRFWEHPVKGEPRWRRIWQREVARMEGRPFENKWYTKDSSYETVMRMSTTTR